MTTVGTLARRPFPVEGKTMPRHTRLAVTGLCVLLITLTLAAVAADAATYKHTKTGETIKGTITNQRINGQNIFKFDDGRTRYVNPDEWALMEGDGTSGTTEPARTGTVTVSGTAPAPATAKRVYVIPISGPIESLPLVEEIDKALVEAKRIKCAAVVFHMNTPGGRLDITDKIIKTIEKIDWAPVVAWVQGDDREALSAGAYICFATQKIYMAPGSTIGAATPYQSSRSIPVAVQEKFMSAFKAKFRSLAQMRGYPSAIADAMVDARTSVVQITLDGTTQLVTSDEALRLQQEHAKDGKLKMGKTINKPGQLITLTSNEAVDCKVATCLCSTSQELMKELGLEGATVIEVADLPARVTKIAQDRKKQYEALRATYIKNMEQANAYDPSPFVPSNPAKAKEFAGKCMFCLQECSKVLTQLDTMAKDEKYDLDIDSDDISLMKARLDAAYARVKVYAGM
jgi:ClpP class serine protease